MNERQQEVAQIEQQLASAQPGDILLFYNATGISRIIPLVTRSPFFHSAVYAGNNEVIEARPVGVIRRDLRQMDDVHYFVIIPAPAGKGRAALAWAETQIGAGYDRKGVLFLLLDRAFAGLHIPSPVNDKWSCGEFVAAAFAKADVNLFPELELSDVGPADFVPFIPPAALPEELVQEDEQQKKGNIGAVVAALILLPLSFLLMRRLYQFATDKSVR